jgi:hydroxymethylglutaryl-CoA reductase (NADPH)
MASWIPRRFRAAADDEPAEPSWLRRQVTASLQDISRRACAHPIHTIVGIALLASTTYVGLLEGSIFDSFRTPGDASGPLDTSSFLYGSRTLRLGEQTAWRWQSEDGTSSPSSDVGDALGRVFLTMIF